MIGVAVESKVQIVAAFLLDTDEYQAVERNGIVQLVVAELVYSRHNREAGIVIAVHNAARHSVVIIPYDQTKGNSSVLIVAGMVEIHAHL